MKRIIFFLFILTLISAKSLGQQYVFNPKFTGAEYTSSLKLEKILFYTDSSMFYFKFRMVDYQFIKNCLSDLIFIQDKGQKILRAKNIVGFPNFNNSKKLNNDSVINFYVSFPSISDSTNSIDFYSNNENCFFFHGIDIQNKESNLRPTQTIDNTNKVNQETNDANIQSGVDLIILKDGSDIKSKVIDVGVTEIKYKKIDNINGPNYSILKSEVFMIIYANGSKDVFKEQGNIGDDGNNNLSNKPKEKYFSNNKNKYYSFSVGYGQSYGGFGVRFQRRWGGKIGCGFHAGGGYFPSSEESGGPAFFYSTGMKFFWYKAWYLNLQYGPTATYRKYNFNTYTYEKGKLYGPSILIGGDWFFNKYIGLNGALGYATNLTDSDFEASFITLDFGFIVKF